METNEYEPVFNEYIEYTHFVEDSGQVPTRIETDSLLFTPLLDFDYVTQTELLEVFSDEKNKYTDQYFDTKTGNPRTYNDIVEYLTYVEELEEEGTDYFYAIYTNTETEGEDFIGLATIELVEWELNRCALGIWLRKEYWGQGISQKRAEAILYAIFDDLDFELVEIHVLPENKKSLRAVEKYVSAFGGAYDGCRRQTTFTPKGEIHDVMYYSISKDEFFSEKTTEKDDLSPIV